MFEFDDLFKERVRVEWEHVLEKPVICIGIRVGQDYVDNGNYEILPINYQLGALYKYFPNWRQEYNIIVFSDNFDYAKRHLDCDEERIFFADGLSDVEQLCLGSMATHFIIPNSTFSWWQAYLGAKQGSVVVRPERYFKNYLATISDTRDLWEGWWNSYPNEGEKFDLRDVTFTIPVKYDHNDRIENLKLSTRWIKDNFLSYVYIGSMGTEFFDIGGFDKYMDFSVIGKDFHRTAILNDLAWYSETPFIINFDADNVCPILQILIGVDMLRSGEAEMVYPYDGRVARLDREKWYTKMWSVGCDFGVLGKELIKGTRPIDPSSVGHIIMWNKDRFLEIGGENQNFISYGPEDVERWERAEKLGVKIKRVRGIVYHMDHYCGPDSSGKNPYFGRNYSELERIRKMSSEELWQEVEKWPMKKEKPQSI